MPLSWFSAGKAGAAVKGGLVVLGGVGFMVVWLAGAAVWGAMSLMGGVMANDAGRVAPATHATLLGVLSAGELLVAAAGVSGGLAFFWTEARGLLWMIFAGLLVAGLLLQAGAIWSFASASS